MQTGGFNKWVLILSISLLALFSVVAWFLQHQFPTIEAEQSLTSNIGFFLLINLNIVVVLILAFLVVKNIIKLSLDRRRKILGAKLRTRLVVAFVGLSLIPTVLLFSVAKGIVERVLQGWFSPQVEASVDGALRVASLYYDESERELKHLSAHLGGRLTKLGPYLFTQSPKDDFLQATGHYLEEKRKEYGLFELALYSPTGERLLRARSTERSVTQPAINFALLKSARSGIKVNAEQSLTAEFLRAYLYIALPERNLLPEDSSDIILGEESAEQSLANNHGREVVLVATEWVGPEVSSSLASVISAHDDYSELRTYRRPLASSYFLTLMIVTLLIIFAAVWVGFYLARGISVPIGLLAEGTQQIAHGNLGHRIPEVGDDELSVLVRSFNTMTADLEETTGELVERRRYMETLLAQVGVGVISLDLDGKISTCNESALCLLGGSENCQGLVGQMFEEVAPASIVRSVEEMRSQLVMDKTAPNASVSSNIALEDGEGAAHVHLSLTTLIDAKAQALGFVLLLDNISDLVSAQRMAAWREVARRIAHEIKNPLTPIQLSAQRIQRRLSSGESSEQNDRQLVLDATSTIIGQVEILRNLVNEFSKFARMPKTNLKTCDLQSELRKVVGFFGEAHPDIEFVCDIESAIQPFPFDADQMNRVFTNLLDNSIAAIAAYNSENDHTKGRITLTAKLNEDISVVEIAVVDNGIGVPRENKPRLFEPYFSTKQSGTGLGLAIVSTIIADHHGYIRVSENEPRGTKVSMELPYRAVISQETHRKIV